MIQIGFLGAGFIARYHQFQLGRCESPHRIAAVFDPDPGRASALAERCGAEVGMSVEDVVERCDAVFVCTWTAEHPAGLAAVLDAGKAVFLEKPVAVDLATAREMARRTDAAGVVNMVGLVLRSSPAMLALRALVSDPDAGRPMNVVFRDDQYLPIGGMYASDWRSDAQRAGAGVLLEHSIHDLDILEWLLGPVASVNAQSAHFHGIDGIEDSVSVLLRFVGGHTATLSTVWHDVTSRPSQRRIEVFSERALTTLEGDFVGPLRWERREAAGDDVSVGRLDDATIVPWLQQRDIRVESHEAQFVRAVASGGPSVAPTIADAVRAHELADAVYRSAAAGGASISVAPEGMSDGSPA